MEDYKSRSTAQPHGQESPNTDHVATQDWRNRCRKWILLATTLPIGLLIYSYFGRYSFFAELVCNFRFQLLSAILIAAMTMACMRGYTWAIAMVAIVLASGPSVYPTAKLFDANHAVNHNAQHSVSVMSFNILGLNDDWDAVLKMITQNDPDILVIIEYTSDWVLPLKQLNSVYPYRIEQPRWHGFGIALFSKLPFSHYETYRLAPDTTDSPMIVADVDLGEQQPLRVAATHLLAPMGYTRMAIRNQQLRETAEVIPADGQPTVLLGDFNCVPWSPFLRDTLTTTQLQDSRRGFGYQGSWPSDFWPMRIPIDHAFVSKNVSVIKRETLKSPTGSDHFPILLELRF